VVRDHKWEQADALDVELHVSIARVTRSPGLTAALDRCHLLEVLRRHIPASYLEQHLDELEVIHRELVDAIASGDPDRAGQAMHAHLSHRFNRNGPQLGGPVR
jgi:DNA-binding FadR family transcriptional regulator